MSKKEKNDYKKVFNNLDTDHSGQLSKKEFQIGAAQFFGDQYPLEQIMEIYNAADLNNDGSIQYGEFVIAAMKQDELHSE